MVSIPLVRIYPHTNLNAIDIKGAAQMIKGSAVSMGMEVVNK